ncbi:MAG: DUF835 domain-containing protein [Candidatus Poseidoniaceae archaeon]|jgi:hypothetical protein|nr:DUF835 domain-containing protein [Candidatus Poseidoniaceae archaeon]
MVELAQGDIVEERRGGAGILSVLVGEMVRLETDGYIRCERTPTDKMPSVGQILIKSGAMIASIYEKKAILEGLDALLEIENDCMELDARIQVIEGVNVARILELYPQSLLNVDLPEQSKSDKWWSEINVRPKSWSRKSRLPEYEASVEAPEFIQRKAASMVQKMGADALILKPGGVNLMDAEESSDLYELASQLHRHGRPLLVLSRRSREDIVVSHDIPAERCLWLSQQEGEGVQFVDPDAIKGTINGFIEGNLRAILLLDGIDYLASQFGTKKVIDLVRTLADVFRMNDHMILATTDLSAFETSEKILLAREFSSVTMAQIKDLCMDTEGLLEHPILAPPSEEEMMRLEEHLEATRPPEIIPDEPEVLEEETIVEEVVPIIIEEEIIDVIEEEPEIIKQVIVKQKGPRKPQIVKRNKSKSLPSLNSNDIRKSIISAANNVEIKGEMKSNKSLPMTSIGKGKEGVFPKIPELIPNSLDQVTNQPSAKNIHKLPKTELGPKPLEAAATNMKSQKKKPGAGND